MNDNVLNVIPVTEFNFLNKLCAAEYGVGHLNIIS